MTDTEQNTEAAAAPEAAPNTTPDTQVENQPALSPEDMAKELAKVRKEAASYRTRAKELQDAAEKAKTEAERSKLDEVERLKAEKADAEKAVAEAKADAARARQLAALTGKVADAEAALKLLDPDKHLDAKGAVKLDDFLTTYPFLKPAATPGGVSVGGQPDPTGKGPLKPSDFAGKSPEWIDANMHRLTTKKGSTP